MFSHAVTQVYTCNMMLQTEVFTLRKNMSTFTSILILRSRRSLAVVAGMKKTNDHAEPTKVER